MDDKRRHKRYSVNLFSIHGKIPLANSVEILNISVGGVLIKLDRRLGIGSNYLLKLQSREKVLSIKGIVTRCSLSESQKDPKGDVVPYYTAGMEFMDISSEKIDEIADFIKRNVEEYQQGEYPAMNQIRDLRMFVRFHIKQPQKSVLQSHDLYTVKNLSVGGMLIESYCPFKTGEKISMDLNIPGEKTIHFLGRIITSRQIGNMELKRYDIGVEFSEMSESDNNIIKMYLNLL
jgi:c-di-GMP-binding flagellar brake protein YcgR